MKVTESGPTRGRILYVITKANWGGAQRYVYDLATAAQEAGYGVTVAYGVPGGLSERLAARGVRLVSLPGFKRDLGLTTEIATFFRLLGLCLAERPDVVHVNSSKGGVALLAARLAGVPRTIFTAHGWAFNEDRPRWQKYLLRFVYAATILLSSMTICVSNAVREDIASLPGMRKKMIVIQSGIDAPAFRERMEAREALLPEYVERIWIGMIAELHPTKRIDDAIEALAQLRQSRPDAILVVLGGGQERVRLEARIKERELENRVFLLGFVPDAAQYLSAFDIFLMPSRSEALGYAAIEAGYAGLPVVASRVGGLAEVIEDGVSGVLVPPLSPERIREALAALIDDPEHARQLGNALSARVAIAFNKERMLRETFALYAR